MGKQQTPSHFTPEQSGITDILGASPENQRITRQENTVSQSLDNRPQATNTTANVFGNQDKGEYDYAISKGAQFNNDPTDQEHTLAAAQGHWMFGLGTRDMGRMLLKFVPMVA